VKTPAIDHFMLEYAPDSRLKHWKDVRYLETLATELRALLAERERLAGEVTEWEGHAQTFEAGLVAAQRELAALNAPASRRLRQYKGVVYENEHWLCRQFGMTYSTVSALIAAHKHHFTDADHAALMLLKEQPYEDSWEPGETLEDVVGKAWSEGFNRGGFDVVGNICKAVRAWLATQPNTPSDAKHVGAALADSTQPQAITPEQAVAVLVEGGAKLEQVTYRATVGSTHMTAGTRILILPTATPESGK
jgi:hypothetical protein